MDVMFRNKVIELKDEEKIRNTAMLCEYSRRYQYKVHMNFHSIVV